MKTPRHERSGLTSLIPGSTCSTASAHFPRQDSASYTLTFSPLHVDQYVERLARALRWEHNLGSDFHIECNSVFCSSSYHLANGYIVKVGLCGGKTVQGVALLSFRRWYLASEVICLWRVRCFVMRRMIWDVLFDCISVSTQFRSRGSILPWGSCRKRCCCRLFCSFARM